MQVYNLFRIHYDSEDVRTSHIMTLTELNVDSLIQWYILSTFDLIMAGEQFDKHCFIPMETIVSKFKEYAAITKPTKEERIDFKFFLDKIPGVFELVNHREDTRALIFDNQGRSDEFVLSTSLIGTPVKHIIFSKEHNASFDMDGHCCGTIIDIIKYCLALAVPI